MSPSALISGQTPVTILLNIILSHNPHFFFFFFFLMIRPPPISTLFPYPPLFRFSFSPSTDEPFTLRWFFDPVKKPPFFLSRFADISFDTSPPFASPKAPAGYWRPPLSSR